MCVDTENVELALQEVCNPQVWGFFQAPVQMVHGGVASTCPSVLNHAAVLGSLFHFACKLTRVVKIGRVKRSREPLAKLHSIETPGQEPREKVNLSQLERLIYFFIFIFLFFLPFSSFSVSQPMKLGGSSGWRRAASGLHAAVGTQACLKHLSSVEMSIALARLFFLCSKEQAKLLICG